MADDSATSHDQLFKDLLHQFFAEFMERFFPDEAARLDLRHVEFEEQQYFTDFPSGERRDLDVIARVPTLAGPTEVILVHYEVEGRWREAFEARMFDYYSILRLRFRLPVLPIALYVTGGRGRSRWEYYVERTLECWVNKFRFRRLRLRGESAAAAVASGDPLLSALAALMDRRGVDPVALKVICLQNIGSTPMDAARQSLLVNLVETYLELSAADDDRYAEMLAQEENAMAKQAKLTWFDQIRLNTRRESALEMLEARFAPLPEELIARIQSISTLSDVDGLFRCAAVAQTLDDVWAALPT